MFVLFNADPFIVNELGPAIVFTQTLPKAVKVVALKAGDNDKVINKFVLP